MYPYGKLICLGAALTLSASLLAGCDNGGETSTTHRLGDSFTADMTLTMADLDAVGTIARYGAGQWQVEFSEPSSLSGIVLDFADGQVQASYQGLAFSIPQSAMPAKSVLVGLIQVVDALAQEEQVSGKTHGDQTEITGDLDGTPYVLTLEQDGTLSGFSMDSMEAALVFTGFQTGAVATPTTQLETEAT